MPDLRLIGVEKQFSTSVRIGPVDLHVPEHDRLVLLGPSGSGKSTLLRLIAGLETPTAGRILSDATDITNTAPHRRGVSWLPQRPTLYPHLSVRDQLGSLGSSAGQLAHLADRRPHELSGGEKQRVALARAIGQRRPILLLDEPTAPLDPVLRDEFRHDLHLLLTVHPATMLLVTHDPIDASALGRRVGVFGDGRLQQIGTFAELADRPANRFVAFTLGRTSLLDGILTDRVGGGEPADWVFRAAEGSVLATPPSAVIRHVSRQPINNLTLGIRPEDVSLRPAPGVTLTGWPVVSAEPVGSGWTFTIARGSCRVRVNGSPESPPRFGDPATWHASIDRMLWFDHTGRRIDTDDSPR